MSILGAVALAACSSLPVPPALIELPQEIGQPPAGMRWATAEEKSKVVDLINTSLAKQLEQEMELAPKICIGQLSLPSDWSWSSGPDPTSPHSIDEWSESYDSVGSNARLVVTGIMSNGSFCGTRLTVIPWASRMRPNNSFKPKPLRGSA